MHWPQRIWLAAWVVTITLGYAALVPYPALAQSSNASVSSTTPLDAPVISKLSLTIDGEAAGVIAVEKGIGSYLIPLQQLAEGAGWVNLVPDQDRLEIAIGSDRYLIDIRQKKLYINGKSYGIAGQLLQLRDNDIWADVSVLSEYMPLRITVDESQSYVNVAMLKEASRASLMEVAQKEATPITSVTSGDLAPPTLEDAAAIVTAQAAAVVEAPVLVTKDSPEKEEAPAPAPAEDIESAPPVAEVVEAKEREAPAELEEAVTPAPVEDEAEETEAAEPAKARVIEVVTSEQCPGIVLPDDETQEYISAEIMLDKLSYDELVDMYSVDGAYFVALPQLAEALSFPVEWDAEAQEAYGWFLSETNQFDLSVEDCSIDTEQYAGALPEASVLLIDDTIFIRQEVIADWFPVGMAFDQASLRLVLTPQVLLPLQARKERELKRVRWQNAYSKTEEELPLAMTPYNQPVRWPFMHIAGDLSLNNGDGEQLSENLSITAAGDTGPVNTKLNASTNRNGIQSLRVVSERVAYGKDEMNFAGLGLTYAAAGDVNGIASELTGTQGIGRGIRLSTASTERRQQFDTVVIDGDLPVDWEVEIYNNDAFIDFQIVGEDGRYQFNDVPLYAGENIIRIVQYGPNGEVREEERAVAIADRLLKMGELTQDIVVQQVNRTLLDSLQESQNEGLFQASWRAEYGVSKRLTAFSEVSMLELDDGYHPYLSGGVTTSLGSWLMQFQSSFDAKGGGSAHLAQANTTLFGQGLRLSQLYLNDYSSRVYDSLSGDPLLYASSIDLSGHMPFFISSGLGYVVGLSREESEAGVIDWRASNRLSTSLYGIGLTHNLLATRTETNGFNTDLVSGGFAMRSRLYDILWRANLNYVIEPEAKAQSASLSLQHRFSKQLTGRLDLSKDLDQTKTTSVSTGIIWNPGDYLLSANLDANDEGDLSFGLGYSTSLYNDPYNDEWSITSNSVTEMGAVRARAYLDADYDLAYDEGEEIIPDAVFKRGNKSFTAKGGQAVITNIDSQMGTNVQLVENELEDAFWYLPDPGRRVIGRPGVFSQLDIPVHDTSELEGIITLEKPILPLSEETLAELRAAPKPASAEDAPEITVCSTEIVEPELDEEGASKDAPAIACAPTLTPGSAFSVFLLDKDGKRFKEAQSEFDGYFFMERIPPGDYLLTFNSDEWLSYGLDTAPIFPIEVTAGGEIISQDVTITLPSDEELEAQKIAAQGAADEQAGGDEIEATSSEQNFE